MPEWKQETPTEPGFYWLRGLQTDEASRPLTPRVAHLYDLYGNGELYLQFVGGVGEHKPTDYRTKFEWNGPIHPPS